MRGDQARGGVDAAAGDGAAVEAVSRSADEWVDDEEAGARTGSALVSTARVRDTQAGEKSALMGPRISSTLPMGALVGR